MKHEQLLMNEMGLVQPSKDTFSSSTAQLQVVAKYMLYRQQYYFSQHECHHAQGEVPKITECRVSCL